MYHACVCAKLAPGICRFIRGNTSYLITCRTVGSAECSDLSFHSLTHNSKYLTSDHVLLRPKGSYMYLLCTFDRFPWPFDPLTFCPFDPLALPPFCEFAIGLIFNFFYIAIISRIILYRNLIATQIMTRS